MSSLQSASGLFLNMVAGGVWPLVTAVVPRALLGGLLGIAVAVTMLVVVRRRGWLRRSPPIWRALVKLHYPLCVLVFLVAGCGAGTIRGVERYANRLVDTQVEPALATWLPTLKTLLLEQLPPGAADEPMSAADAAQRLLQRLYSAPASDSALDQGKARAINWVTLNFGKWVITASVTALAGYAMGKTGDTLGLTPETVKFTVRTIADMDLSRVDRNVAQIVLDALRHQLDALFHTAYRNLALAVAVATLIAVGEILAHELWWKRRSAGPVAAAPSPPTA